MYTRSLGRVPRRRNRYEIGSGLTGTLHFMHVPWSRTPDCKILRTPATAPMRLNAILVALLYVLIGATQRVAVLS